MDQAVSYTNGYSAGSNDIADYCIQDLSDIFNQNDNKLHKSILFRVIRSGDTDLVKEVLTRLEYHKDQRLFRRIAQGSLRGDPSTYDNCIYTLLRIPVILLTIIIAILFLPILFIIHRWTIYFYHDVIPWISNYSQLVLVQGVLSEEIDMVRLLNEFGVAIDGRDSYGNNAVHHIVKQSRDDPEKAVRCTQMLIDVYGGAALEAITLRENNHGLTPLESAIKFGSVSYFLYLCNLEGIFKQTIMNVNTEETWLRTNAQVFRSNPAGSSSLPPKYSYCFYDVSLYESRTHSRRRSMLLSLINSLPLSSLSKEDVLALKNDQFLSKYCTLTVRSFLVPNGVMWIIRAFVCVIILVFINELFSSDIYPWSFKEFAQLYIEAAKRNGVDVANAQRIDQFRDQVAANFCQPMKASVFRGIHLDACATYAMQELKKSCQQAGVSDETLFAHTNYAATSNIYDISEHPYLDLFFGLALFQTVAQLIQIISAIGRNLWSEKSISSGMKALLSRPLPGSYLGHQVSMFIRFLIFALFIINIVIIPSLSTEYDRVMMANNSVLATVAVTLTTGVYLLHTCRLAPLVGQFILSLFAMVKILTQFVFVMFGLVVAFGFLLQIFVRDQQCPTVAAEGYETEESSIFSAYFLMLGMGSEPENDSAITILVVVAYTTSTMLVMLNLIIAMMSAVGDNMMNNPWRDMIAQQETLDFSLETEALVRATLWPCSDQLVSFLKRNAGFRIRSQQRRWDDAAEEKVLVEVEQTF